MAGCNSLAAAKSVRTSFSPSPTWNRNEEYVILPPHNDDDDNDEDYNDGNVNEDDDNDSYNNNLRIAYYFEVSDW